MKHLRFHLHDGAMAAIIILIVAAIVIAWHYIAKAETVHDWIHLHYPSCCTGLDCMPAHAWRTVGGVWMVYWHSAEVPYHGEVRGSPAETWACGRPGQVWCLFVKGGTA